MHNLKSIYRVYPDSYNDALCIDYLTFDAALHSGHTKFFYKVIDKRNNKVVYSELLQIGKSNEETM